MLHLMRKVFSGQSRIFYAAVMPTGFAQAAHTGYLVRIDGTDCAALTDSGLAFLTAHSED